MDDGFEELPECSRAVASSAWSAVICVWSLSTSSRKGPHCSQVGGVVDFVILTESYPAQDPCLGPPPHLVLLAGYATQRIVSARQPDTYTISLMPPATRTVEETVNRSLFFTATVRHRMDGHLFSHHARHQTKPQIRVQYDCSLYVDSVICPPLA